jgi:hypothetical protein
MFKPQRLPIQNLPTFRYGLNDMQSPDEIRDDELADVENFSVEEDSLATAPGYARWDDDYANHPGPYWGGVAFVKSDGYIVEVRQRQDKLEYVLDGGETWAECTLPTTGSPATTISLSQVPCTFTHLNDTLLFANGQYVMSSTDGVTWTNETSLPLCKVVFHNGKNRVLFLNQVSNPFRFDWSDINDPLTVGASAYQLVDPNNNGKIVGAGLTPEGTTLIFKDSAVYSVSDYVDAGIIDINFIGNVTIASHQSICTTENSVMWAGFDGVYEYIGGVIRYIFGRINPIGRNDVYRGELYCAAYYNNKYHLSKPDADIDYEYNCQEYVVYKQMLRNDPIQPYVVTRNRRYFGMYYVSDFEYSYGRDIALNAGDSREEFTTGSPAAYGNTFFGYINDYRWVEDAGLAGEEQTCYFVTKYFQQNIPYYVKKFKKVFLSCKFDSAVDIIISYRFDPFDQWTDNTVPVTSSEIEIEYDDGDSGTFSEGYGFSQQAIANLFVDIENNEKPRGIQFKVSVTSIQDVTNFGMAYQFRPKIKFK